MAYSRETPSPRYRELIELYAETHEKGDARNETPPEQTFAGFSLFPYIDLIGTLVSDYAAASLLDYGAGKGEIYRTFRGPRADGTEAQGLADYWGLADLELYDPAYAPYAALPTRGFDGVVSTDVLEHCPEEDIDWIVAEMFGLCRKFLFCSIATYPASKSLPNGENAHVTLKSAGWWVDRFESSPARADEKKYHLAIAEDFQGRTLYVVG